MKKTVGIIGGMGPLATCDLMEKVIKNTKAGCDQEHIHLLVDSNTDIPDRTRAILGEGEDPVFQLQKSADTLMDMGAKVLIMPCNTAHYFYDRIKVREDVTFLHMPAQTAAVLGRAGIKRAAVLATDGTLKSGLYDCELRKAKVEPIYPDIEGQRALMSLIYDYVKAGKTDLSGIENEIKALVFNLKEKGAEKLILGCTELPLAFDMLGLKDDTLDPTNVLARAAVTAAGYELV